MNKVNTTLIDVYIPKIKGIWMSWYSLWYIQTSLEVIGSYGRSPFGHNVERCKYFYIDIVSTPKRQSAFDIMSSSLLYWGGFHGSYNLIKIFRTKYMKPRDKNLTLHTNTECRHRNCIIGPNVYVVHRSWYVNCRIIRMNSYMIVLSKVI